MPRAGGRGMAKAIIKLLKPPKSRNVVKQQTKEIRERVKNEVLKEYEKTQSTSQQAMQASKPPRLAVCEIGNSSEFNISVKGQHAGPDSVIKPQPLPTTLASFDMMNVQVSNAKGEDAVGGLWLQLQLDDTKTADISIGWKNGSSGKTVGIVPTGAVSAAVNAATSGSASLLLENDYEFEGEADAPPRCIRVNAKVEEGSKDSTELVTFTIEEEEDA